MAETPRLDLPYLAASQAQKEVYHNVSLDRLDLLVQCAVLDRNLTTPPGSPTLGDVYIVAATGTGAWAGHDNHLALWVNSQWLFIAPLPGFLCWVLDEGALVYWSGTAWTIITTGGGGATTFLALTDTPDSFSGQGGKVVQVNAGATALEFATAGGGGGAPTDATYLVSTAHGSLSAERVITDSPEIEWDLATAGQVRALIPANALTLGQIETVLTGTLLGRWSTGVGNLQTITLGTGLLLSGGVLSATGVALDTEGLQDLVGAMMTDSATLDFTYDDGAGTVTAIVKETSITEGKLSLSDVTTANVTTAQHGLVPKAPNVATQYLNGLGTWATMPYDVGGTWSGTLPASQVLLRYPFPRAVDFPAGLTNSRGVAAVAATALTTLDIRKNGTSVGSMQFAASATTATFTMASATSFAAGDVLTLVAPGTPDATLADLGVSLAGTRT